MADSVRARRSGTDGEHVRREREAIITGTQWRRHGSRDVSLGEVASCVEGRSPREVASMVEERSPGGKFRPVEAFFPNKRVVCGPAGHADNLCVRPQSFVRGTQNTTNGDLGDSVVMTSGELISGPVRLQESAVMLSGTAGLSTDFVVHNNDDDILDGSRLLIDHVSDGDDGDDNDVLDRSELEHLTGIWGDVMAKMRETDDEDERSEKRVDFSGNVSVEMSKILHAGSKQGNVVLSPLFQLR